MKRSAFLKNVLAFCLPIALLCSGCTEKPADAQFSPNLDPNFSVDAVMVYGDRSTEAAFTLTRYDAGAWDAAFSEPSSLAGVILSFENNAVSASYKGLSFTVPKSALPAKTMLLLVTDVLDSLTGLETIPCTAGENGSWEVSGESEGGSYTLTFSSDGMLNSFDIPSQPLVITFSGYTIQNATPPTDGSTETTPAETTAAAPSVTESAGATESAAATESIETSSAAQSE